MNRLLIRALLLFLPTLILAGWALSVPWQRADDPLMRIRLVGYDPRDLLRGHYLLARLDIADLPPGRYGADDCVCLRAGAVPGRPLFTPLPSCAPAVLASCPLPLSEPGREVRLYQPAEKAARLQELLSRGDARVDIDVRFDGKGGIALETLRVDGSPLEQVTEGKR